MIDRKAFYDGVRRGFPGKRLKVAQVAGMEDLLDAIEAAELPNIHAAYVLATAAHETGFRMEPVREGFASTEAQAVAAVTRLFRKGVIRKNYALRNPVTGQRYYGRGFVQLTWRENYVKTGDALGVDLENNPDLMLDGEISAKAIVWGMHTGAYRKRKSLASVIKAGTEAEYVAARDMINGDTGRKYPGMKLPIGLTVAGYALMFLKALGGK